MTARDPLPVELDRWSAQHLISADQARAILSAEASRTAAITEAVAGPIAPTETPTRRGLRHAVLAEVLGSLGAIAAAAAAVVGTAVLWSDLTTVARTAIPAVGALALLVAGAAVPGDGDRSSERLGALLWLLAVGAVAATVAVITTDILEWAGQNVALAAGVVALALSLSLLRRSRSPHLVLAVVGSALCSAVGAILQYDGAQAEHIGVVVMCLGAAVVLLGWAAVLPQRSTTTVAGGIVAFVGAEMLGGLADHWPIVAGAVIASGLLALFVGSRDRAALVTGLTAALVVVIQGIVELAADDGGGAGRNRWVVLLVFAVGAAVLAASIIAIRSSGRSRRPA